MKWNEKIGSYFSFHLVQVVGRGSEHPIAISNLAAIIYDEGEHSEALNLLENAIQLKSNSSIPFSTRASIYRDLRNWKSALVDYQSAGKEYQIFAEICQRYLDAEIEFTNLGCELLMKKFDKLITKLLKNQEVTEKICLVHYTSLKVLKSFLGKERASLRGYDSEHMNDPEEGKVMFSKITSLVENQDLSELTKTMKQKLKTFAISFINGNEKIEPQDNLLFWRLYGKTDGKEGTGINLMFEKAFSSTRIIGSRTETIKQDYKGQEIAFIPKKAISTEQMSMNGSESTFPLENARFYKVKYIHENEIVNELSEINSLINQVMAKNPSKKIKEYFIQELLHVSHLFKNKDFEYENEIRLIWQNREEALSGIVQIDSDGTYPRKYVTDDFPIFNFLKQITLGPCVEHPNEWKQFIEEQRHKHQNSSFDVEISRRKFLSK